MIAIKLEKNIAFNYYKHILYTTNNTIRLLNMNTDDVFITARDRILTSVREEVSVAVEE